MESTTSAQEPDAPGTLMRWPIWPSRIWSATRAISAAFASSSSTTSLKVWAISPSMPVRLSGMRTVKSPRLNARMALRSSPRSSTMWRPGWIVSIASNSSEEKGKSSRIVGAIPTAGYPNRLLAFVVISTTGINQKIGVRPRFFSEENRSVDQVVGDRVVHQLRVRLHVHLAQDAGAVGADGVWTQKQFIRNLANRLSRGDHPHHLVLAVGKRLVQGLAAVVLELERELLAQRGGDVAAAAGNLADGAHQLLGRALLRPVARGPRLERAHAGEGLAGHGERPPPATLRMALTSSSGALSFVR